VGLSGAIVKGFHLLIEYFKEKFSSDKEDGEDNEQSGNSSAQKNRDSFTGITLKLLRYSSDDTTTTGTLYLNNTYYCLTLEPPAGSREATGNKRIPAGTYEIQFSKEDAGLTQKYKEKYPEWFIRHLQLKDVPGLNSVIIHNANDTTSTAGFVVFNTLNIGNKTSFLSNSEETYRRLYRFLSDNLDMNIQVRIIVYDEKWIEKIN